MDKEFLPDFSGKCISMSVVDSECCHDLFDPHFEYQGGKLFIVGTIPVGATDSDWNANQLGAVAWSGVQNYVLFDDLDAYVKAVAISEAFQSKNSDR
ncbi:hypothetical protein [Litoribacillus peritrichatus]|uniref:Uncharacterized protein n=1 Tax=Litoribacillus peritrichatus TaxID=718191 RepID=A0ABP7N654_9GAMM